MAQKEQTSVAEGLAGKLFMLKRLGMTDAEIDTIRDNASADVAIKFLNEQQRKNEVPSDKPKITLESDPLPPTDQQIRENMESNPVSFAELNDPRQPDEARLNLLNQEGRIIKMYSDEFPNGGIF